MISVYLLVLVSYVFISFSYSLYTPFVFLFPLTKDSVSWFFNFALSHAFISLSFFIFLSVIF